MKAFDVVPLDLPYETVMPAYQGRSILNVHHSLLCHFGVSPGKAILDSHQQAFDDAGRVVVLCIDALGYFTVARMLKEGRLPFLSRLLEHGHFEALTTVFPSSTPIVLRALSSGLSAAELELPGFAIYLEEHQQVADILRFQLLSNDKAQPMPSFSEAGISVEAFFFETLYQKLARHGVDTTVLFPYRIFQSQLSLINQQGASQRQAYITPADMMLQLRERLAQTKGQRHLLSLYWDAIDVMQHVHGADHRVVEAELASLIFSLEREFTLDPAAFADTRLILVSDHGHTQVQQHDIFDQHAALLEVAEMPFLGTIRTAYFKAKGGEVERLLEVLKKTFPDYLVLPNQALIATGIFGTLVSDTFRQRMGDVAVLAPPGRGIWYSKEGTDSRVLGRHGGFTPEEMLIPFLSVRFDT